MKRLILAGLVFLLLTACGPAPREPVIPSEEPSVIQSQAEPQTEGEAAAVSARSESAAENPEPAETDVLPEAPYEITDSYASAYRSVVGEVRVQVMIAVKNTSDTPLFLDYSQVNVQVSGDEHCQLDYVEAFPNLIAPGETGYYYEENALTYQAEGLLPLEAELNIFPWKEEPERYPVSNTSLRDSSYEGIVLRGRLDDPLQKNGKLVNIAGIAFDREGKPLTVLYTIFTEGTSAVFEITNFMLPETITADAIGSFEVYAYPYDLEAIQ